MHAVYMHFSRGEDVGNVVDYTPGEAATNYHADAVMLQF